MKPLTETQIQKQIITYLKLKRVFHFRINTGGLIRRGIWCPSPNVTKGCPDIVTVFNRNPDPFMGISTPDGVTKGILVAIEVKSAKGKQSPDQKKFQIGLEASGGVYLLVRSLDEVRAYFEAQNVT